MKHLTWMFHFKFHVSLFKPLWERIIAPTVFLFFSLSVFLNETLKLKMKHKSRMFQPLKTLSINGLKHKNET